MSEDFNSKDYAEYFSLIEESLNKEKQTSSTIEQPIAEQPTIEKPKKIKPSVRLNNRAVFLLAVIAVVVVGAIILTTALSAPGGKIEVDANSEKTSVDKSEPEKIVYPFKTKKTLEIGSEIDSQHIVIMKVADHSIVAFKDGFAKAYPASITKIMTLLTALDYIKDFSDTFTMTYEITDPLFVAEATVAGFAAGEVITVEDMLYGIILPSGGDASIGIATKIAGSEAEFVKLMNKKARKFGLTNTNFTNCTGLFDANHYTTAADMAVILSEAIKNPLCKKILSTYKYTTKPTPQHPDGIELSATLFNYMYGTEPEGADILGGKTGFVNESGYCIASFGQSDNGEEYIVVTLESTSKWPAFYGQIDLYSTYVGKKDKNSE